MMMEGRYSFRFGGFAMSPNAMPNYLVGIGIMNLQQDGTLTGSQNSSITRVQGQGAQLLYATFALTGSYTFSPDGTGAATIKFVSSEQTLVGTFDFVKAGSDRFWMISTGAELHVSEGTPLPTPVKADEVVSGEAILLP
jgi:hypothetical protein